MFTLRVHATSLSVVGITLLLAGTAGAQQTFHSTTQKYRERNPSAATGRSGGASLTARLLKAKDGTTLAEVTTGELDSDASAPGALTKVKLKGFDNVGETMFTLNANTLTGGGYWKQSYSTFALSQPFEVQGNIRSIDGKRTDVVTVTTSVQRRPDIEVSQLTGPNRARVNTPVVIAATLRELNGDIGAKTDCVLTVDGVEARRFVGVWVDSGDAVTCKFEHAFDSPGSRMIKVTAANVRPGDWDTANNAVETGIDVHDTPPSYEYAYANAWAYKSYSYYYKGYGKYVSSTGTGSDWFRETTHSWKDYEGAHYEGYLFNGLGSAPASLTFTMSDGIRSFKTTRQLSGVCFESGWDNSGPRAVWYYTDGCWNSYLLVYAQTYAGTITYYDVGENAETNGTTRTVVYAWNHAGKNVYGDGTADFTGTSRKIDVALTTENGETVSLPVTVTLSAYQAFESQPETCRTSTYADGSSNTYCESVKWNYDYLQGSSFVQGASSVN